MKLYYYDRHANFGDGMNSWLWPRLLPGSFDADDGISFSGIGTIIGPSMPPSKRWIVFTSGVGYGGVPAGFGGDGWSIVAVRGPLSAAALGLEARAAVTDGAILLATLPEYAALAEEKRDGILFIPHHQTDGDADWQEVCRRAGVEYLPARLDSREVIGRIRGARLVLAEAMHAAIVADTMRVPFVPISGSPQVNSFKWLDWSRSLHLPYEPVVLPPANVASALRHRMLWAYRESYQFDATDEEAALAYFKQRFRAKPGRLQTRVRRVVRRQHERLDSFLRGPRAAAQLRGRDERLIDRTAAALAAAARRPGFLSDDGAFLSRVDELVSRLQTVRELAGDERAFSAG
jgi:succinoglycan biosynthesis protein ExoV